MTTLLLAFLACSAPATVEDFVDEASARKCDGWEAYQEEHPDEEGTGWPTREECTEAALSSMWLTVAGPNEECEHYSAGKGARCLRDLEDASPEALWQGEGISDECYEVCGENEWL